MSEIKKKIMIIEDNKDLQEIYKHSFEKHGYTVVVEENGLEGVNSVIKELPDVILLDLMMPGMDGFGFLRKMKETGGLSIPVVVCSNISDVDTINRALNDGATDVILKVDYSGKQLVDKVNFLVDEFYHKKVHAEIGKSETS
jgi:two-component system alkaline phosphatase synthesis response regulator PhoP